MPSGKWGDRVCICSRKTCPDTISITPSSHALDENARRNYFCQFLSSATKKQRQNPQNMLKLCFNDTGILRLSGL